MFIKVLLIVLLCCPLLATATYYPMPHPGNDLIGEMAWIRAEQGDTLNAIGDRYGLGLHEMVEANPSISQGELCGGEQVLLPTQFVLPKYRRGIVINVAECRLYYFSPDKSYVLTYPVGLGREGWRTPMSATSVIRKGTDPSWTVPSNIRAYVLEQTGNHLPNVVPPGPDNPLGPYAMYLGTHGYLIHGTNQPWTIGKYNGAGCIRMYNNHVEELYSKVKTGTPVYIIHQPYKAGWQNGQLYLEAHIPVALPQRPSDLNMISAERSVLIAKPIVNAVNWDHVRELVDAPNGIPMPVQ